MKISRLLSLPLLLTTTATLAMNEATRAQFFDFGAVYTLTNDTQDNAVKVALRLPSGGLWPIAEYATSGTGTGGGLGSQGALATSADDRWLLAVDPGSNEITLFRSFGGLFLWRRDTDDSRGTRPTSVAVHGNLVYVLNAGSDSIVGFRIHNGSLQPIASADYALSQSGAAAAQVGFSPDGAFVVVTERASNRIGVWRVQANGTLGAGQFQASAGSTPFGFLFRDDGTLVVSEAAGGAPGASVVSSYRIQPNGTLQTITSAAATNQTAACWIAIPRQGQFAYATNTGSGTVSGYALNPAGALTLLSPSGIAGDLGASAAPLDFDFAPNGVHLFVLDSAGDSIRAFRRMHDGSLHLLGTNLALDDGAAGLLVR